jgi:hypothetical protein
MEVARASAERAVQHCSSATVVSGGPKGGDAEGWDGIAGWGRGGQPGRDASRVPVAGTKHGSSRILLPVVLWFPY